MVSDQVGRLAARKTAKNQKAIDDNGASVYNARSSVSPAQGSRQSGADASRNQRGRLRSTPGRATTPRLAASFVVGTPLSTVTGPVPAGVGAGSGRCLASGSGGAGKVGHDEQRLAIAAAVRALLEDGVKPATICRELGLTKPRYHRILDRLNIAHINADRGERFHDLGPELGYTIQVFCGHGSPLLEFRYSVTYPTPRHEETQECEL